MFKESGTGMNHKSFTYYINTRSGYKIVRFILLIHFKRSLKSVHSLISSKAAHVPRLSSLISWHPFPPSVASNKTNSHHLYDFPLPTGPGAPFKLRPWCLVLAWAMLHVGMVCLTLLTYSLPLDMPLWQGTYLVATRLLVELGNGPGVCLGPATHAAPWPPVLGNLVTQPSTSECEQVLSLWFLLLWQHNYLCCPLFFWVGYIFLKKEQLQLYPMPTYVPTSKVYIAAKWGFCLCSPPFLIIALIQFACCWAVSQCFPRTVRNDSNILPQVVIASLESIIAFMHVFFFPPMCITLHLLALNLICYFIAKSPSIVRSFRKLC